MNTNTTNNWKIDLATSHVELKKRIAFNNKNIKKLLDIPRKTFDNFTLPLIMQEERLANWFFYIGHLDNVKNSSKTRKAMQDCIPMISNHQTNIMQNEAIYAALQYITATDLTLTSEQKRALELELIGFKLEGIKQPASIKKQIKNINAKLSILENEFSQNVLADTNSFTLDITNKKDLEGIPQTDIDSAYLADKNIWRFTLHAPSYIAYMTYGQNRDVREKLYKAYVTRGAKNTSLMDEILSLRDKKAHLLGFNNFAELSIASKSAQSPQQVLEFLNDLADKCSTKGFQEIEELKKLATKHNIDNLQSFDTAYLSEKLRKQIFDLDEEEYRPYFELNSTTEGLFKVCSQLFNISFKKQKIRLWNTKAAAYEVIEDGKTIGILYLDLESSKTKKSGAWMDESSSACIDENGNSIIPHVYIVCNFPKSSKNSPSLLKHSDVETLFHEMGHALHHLLSKVQVASVSGVNGVAWDVVEFPSQFFEQFAYDKQALQLFAKHYQTTEVLPDVMIDKLKSASNFQSALAMLRQLEFAIFDLKLHCKKYNNDEMQILLDEIRQNISPLKPPQYNKMQNSFAHIFSGSYAAGYYSYKWAEALSADAFLQFDGLNKTLGKKFRDTVLALGASKPMYEIFKELMGRSLDSSSLLKLNGI